MLDFNSSSTFSERFEALIDAGLQAREQQQARRRYLGASRLGVSCERQLQYEYAQAPVDPLQVIVKADQTLAFRATPNATPRDVSRDELLRLVAEAQKKNPQQAVVVAGDKSVRYEAVMKVMDDLQKQQVARVGLLVQQGQ